MDEITERLPINGEYTLESGELHPMVYLAYPFINEFRSKHKRKWNSLKKILLSKNDRTHLMILETMKRIEKDEQVDHVYVLGVAWYLFEVISSDSFKKVKSVKLT